MGQSAFKASSARTTAVTSTSQITDSDRYFQEGFKFIWSKQYPAFLDWWSRVFLLSIPDPVFLDGGIRNRLFLMGRIRIRVKSNRIRTLFQLPAIRLYLISGHLLMDPDLQKPYQLANRLNLIRILIAFNLKSVSGS